MTGASFNHNLIAMNIASALHSALRDSSCFVFASDMKIQVEEDSHYAYPDVSVVCGDIEFVGNRDDIIANPVIIVEILSQSTKNYDRGDKFNAYRKIRSLRDYILADQYACHIEYFFKNDADRWELDEFENPNDSFQIRSVGVELSLEAVYHRVRF